jgi:CheY-like chemotaxis protein
LSPRRRIPVIVVTVEDDEGRTRLLSAADHITKPIDRARLRGWLAQVADGQRGGG